MEHLNKIQLKLKNTEMGRRIEIAKEKASEEIKQHHVKIDFIIDEIKKLQEIMHVGFMDNINELHYGALTKNLHTNIVEISDFINRHEMNAEQSAKSLFDIMLRRDFFNCLIGK